MGTRNVAGIGLDALDTFVEQLSDNYVWDVMLLQEGFRQTDGIAMESKHVLFPSGHLVANLCCPAILVNERWRGVAEISFAGSGDRWVAVCLTANFLVISLHLPHRRRGIADFTAPLDELRCFLENRKEKNIIIGLDANAEVNSVVDYCHVGDSVPLVVTDRYDLQRACLTSRNPRCGSGILRLSSGTCNPNPSNGSMSR